VYGRIPGGSSCSGTFPAKSAAKARLVSHSRGSRPSRSAATSRETATTVSDPAPDVGVGATKEKAAPETWRTVLEVSGSAGRAEAKVERQRKSCHHGGGGGGRSRRLRKKRAREFLFVLTTLRTKLTRPPLTWSFFRP